jgi:aryl-alcohol dehydrogenase-like predicted oxidoreductase
MRMRPLGKTSLVVSELALGTWGLSGDAYGPVPEAEQDRVIDRAVALGISLYETADVYGNGAMERRLGERLPVASTHVVTKIGTDRAGSPPRKRFDAAYLKSAFEKSRERLRRDTVDVVLLHNPALVTVERGEATAVLAELKAEGALSAWGVSAGSAEIARAALDKGADVVSLAYNALFTSDVVALEPDLAKSGAALLAHSVLAHGLLSGFWSLHKEFPPGDHRRERWMPDDLRRRVPQTAALRVFVGGDVLTPRSGAIRFVLTNPRVTAAILGPKNVMQLDQLVREAGKEPPYLTEEKLTKFRARLDDLGVTT